MYPHFILIVPLFFVPYPYTASFSSILLSLAICLSSIWQMNCTLSGRITNISFLIYFLHNSFLIVHPVPSNPNESDPSYAITKPNIHHSMDMVFRHSTCCRIHWCAWCLLKKAIAYIISTNKALKEEKKYILVCIADVIVHRVALISNA